MQFFANLMLFCENILKENLSISSAVLDLRQQAIGLSNLQAQNAATLLRLYFMCVVTDQIQEALLEVRGTVIKGWQSKGRRVQEHQFSPWILSSFDTICGCFREVLQLFWVSATA